MTVSKSLRFQILRRDNHTCRYCGASAPDAKITIDHVVPVAHGGTDDPSNLVAACPDCNAGKAATSADAAVVADVAQDAVRWAAAMQVAAQAASNGLAERMAYRELFLDEWKGWTFGGHVLDLPVDWRNTVDRFYGLGLPYDVLGECVRIAMRSNVTPSKTFNYMCGVAWRKVTAMQEAAKDIVLADGADD